MLQDEIYNELATEISRQPAGRPFHSVRALMTRFATSQRTVEAVLARLVRSRCLYRQGKRFYPRDTSAARVAHYRFLYPNWTSEFIGAYRAAFADAARAARGAFVVSERSFAIEDDYLQQLPLDDCDGVLIIPQTRIIARRDIEALAALPVPAVLLEYDVGGLGLSMVCGDSRSCGLRAAAHLIARGYRRLAAVITEPPCHVIDSRCQGFREYAELAGAEVEVIDGNVISGRLSQGVFYDALRARLRSDPFDGLFLTSAWPALEVYKALADAGLRIPGDVGVITSDDLASNAYMDPPLTSIGYAVPAAVDAALAGLRSLSGDGDFFHRRLPPQLTPRASTAGRSRK